MTTKSRILEAVPESTCDLHRLGFIDKRKMQKYDALCLEPFLAATPLYLDLDHAR
ncbi:MAG: hypothetical protein PHO57_01810 [Acidithiobacillus sp.]|nr:hypothetical protein [Acidithiobacillus sp.]